MVCFVLSNPLHVRRCKSRLQYRTGVGFRIRYDHRHFATEFKASRRLTALAILNRADLS